MTIDPGIVSAEENRMLTSTGAGTPMGEVLRRYWWPVAISDELKEKPTFIRVMGEDLVLFRDRRGRVGLIEARCAHRRANLCLGTVGLEGLRCRYHGWLYDTQGKIVDAPGTLPGSDLRERVRQRAYPVEELGGLVFAYMGPAPAPLLPRFDFLTRPGLRLARVIGFANSNWLQLAENGCDPLHVTFAHAMSWGGVASAPIHMSFDETEWGLIYRSGRPIDKREHFAYREQHWLMPGVTLASEGYGRMTANDFGALQLDHALMPRGARYNVPIDDTHTILIRVIWVPEGSKAEYDRSKLLTTPDWRPDAVEPYREHRRMEDATTLGYGWPNMVSAQDATIQDSMGALADREHEHLTPSDGGVVIARKVLRDSIAAVKAGRDPKGVLRDPAKNREIEIPVFEDVLGREDFERATRLHEAAE
jgi:5,5'-dehydrodivanillate O-demethylase oxygenase subunit